MRAVCALLIVLSVGAAHADEQIQVDGVTRSYIVHRPPGASGKLPLVLVLHGGGGRASGMEAISRMDRVADRHGFVAVYPQGAGRVWNDGGSNFGKCDDVRFLRVLVQELALRLPIDEKRVYACGFSNGGAMASRLALEAPDLIAGAAMVGSGLYEKHAREHTAPHPMSVLIIEGTDDPCHPYAGGETRGPNAGGVFKAETHGRVLSTADALAFWRKADHCASDPQRIALPHRTADPTSTTYECYSGADGCDVAAYIVKGGGHCWPGGVQYFPVSVIGQTSYDFSAGEAIWRFFSRDRP